MKIYIVSVAGYPNYGDELIMKNWVSWLRRHFPLAEIWLDVPNPAILTCIFKNEKLHITNALWRLIADAPEPIDILNLQHYLQDKIANLGTPNIDISLLNLRDIDIFHVIGGGYINSMWQPNIGILLSGILIKSLYHAKLFVTGNGFLPMSPSDRDRLIPLLKQCDYCESRDIEGAELLQINFGFDDAYLMDISPQCSLPEEDIPDVMVCIQRDLIQQETFDKLVIAITERLVEHKKQGLRLGYIEAIPGGDRCAYEQLTTRLGEIPFFNAAEAILYGLPMKKGQLWYSTRFHHHLVASYYGCQGVALGIKEGYYDVKHQSIIRNGSGWQYKASDDENLPIPSLAEDGESRLKRITHRKQNLAAFLYKTTP